MAVRLQDSTGDSEFTWRGCSLVLMAFMVNLLSGGIYKGMGVLLPTLKDQFTTHTWVIGVMVSLMSGVSVLTGLLTKPLDSKLGSRKLVILSTSVFCSGLLLVPLATDVIFVAIPLVVIVGPPFGINEVLHRVVLGRHFHQNYAFVCGVAHSGVAIALMTFAPMVQLFLDTYGWRGATLLMAGVCCHSIASAALVRDAKQKPNYQPISDDDYQDAQDDLDRKTSIRARLTELCQSSDVGMLVECKFWIVYSCRAGVCFSYSAWVVYYVPHLITKGFSPDIAAALCSAAAVGYLLGTFLWGPLVDRGLLRSTTATIISSLILSASFLVDPWVDDILGYAAVTVVCGMFTSSVYTLNDVFVKETFGLDRLTNAFAWTRLFLFPPILASGFLPGWIYDTSGSYDSAFIFIGCVPTLSMFPLIIGLILKKT